MENELHFILPASLFSNSKITGSEIRKISLSVKEFCNNELSGIMGKIKTLSLVSDDFLILQNFQQLIPLLLNRKNLNIQRFKKHCRSCIITESEVFELAEVIHNKWMDEADEKYQDKELLADKYPDFISFKQLPLDVKMRYCELVYIIPIIFKKAGFEIIRRSEAEFINIEIAEKLARVIYSKYRKSIGTLKDDSKNIYKELYLVDEASPQNAPEFDDLSEDIQMSNIDNAYHIPTKLLSIGYKIQYKFEKDIEIPLLLLTDPEIETMARIEHDRWCWERRLAGWTYAKKRDNSKKYHNCLIPFDNLPEEEKRKDRILVNLIPSLLKDICLGAVPLSPEISEKISYVKKDWGCISDLKTSVSRLKSNLPDKLIQHLEYDIRKVESSIEDLKDAFNNGKELQNSFLPSVLVFKEYLSDSFVLNKPKDIVSGDFYFISKIENTVVLSAADCTGHSISAAMLTSVCYYCLDLAVRKRKMTDPSKILNFAISRIKEFLRYDRYSNVDKFGMDFTICALDTEKNILRFSGFGRPLYYFTGGEFKEIKGVGSNMRYRQAKKVIRTEVIPLSKGDSFYIFSDGYVAQFGENGKKFKSSRFCNILTEIQELSPFDQCEKLNQTIEYWRRSTDINQSQTDDILVIGVKI
jgi:serine phosphatase RsbU (regulator of sigma subunit)